MKLKNTIVTLSMLMGIQAFAMEMPQQPGTEYFNHATLLGLQADVKGYLLSYAVQGSQMQMEQAIFTLAATNKQLINIPSVMIAILNNVLQKSPYVAHAVALAERLQTKEKTLPVMKNPLIVDWTIKMRGGLKNGQELYRISASNPVGVEDKFVSDRNLDLNYQDIMIRKRTPLMVAAESGLPDMVRILLDAGADYRLQEIWGTDALLYSVERRFAFCAGNLLKAGANPNVTDYDGNTPLIVAARKHSPELVKMLLDYGADPDLKTKWGTARDVASLRASGWSNGSRKGMEFDAIIKLLDEASTKRKQKLALKQMGKQ